MAQDKDVYTYGSDDKDTITSRIRQWISSSMLAEYIEWALSDNEKCISFRAFIFGDEELVKVFHLWLEENLGWPIDSEDPANFWNLKFARRFTVSEQGKYLLKFFKEKIQPSMSFTDDEEFEEV